MNDLQVWPESYNIDYDPHSLKPGDLLKYVSRVTGHTTIYELVEILNHYRGNAVRKNHISFTLNEVFNSGRDINPPVSRAVFPYSEYTHVVTKNFAIKLKHEDKILKSNMCKVLAARVFANEELNQLLLELEI